MSKTLRTEISGHMGMSEALKCTAYYSAETYAIIAAVQAGLAYMQTSPSPNLVSLKVMKHFPSQSITCKMDAM